MEAVNTRVTRSNKEFSPYILRGEDIILPSIRAQDLFDRAASDMGAREDGEEEELPIQVHVQPMEENQATAPEITSLEDLSQTQSPRRSPRIQRVYEFDPSHSAMERRRMKAHIRYRNNRNKRREADQDQRGSTLKACALKHMQAMRTSGSAIRTTFRIPRREWTGPRIPYDPNVYTLSEMLGIPGMAKVPWGNIRETRYLRVEGGRRIGVLNGWPDDRWPGVMREVRMAQQDVHSNVRYTSKMQSGRRGAFDAISFGASFGGGQTHPMMLSHSEHNAGVLDRFRSNVHVQRVIRSQDYAMQAHFPALHNMYNSVLDRLIDDDDDIHRNFPQTCFAASTLNSGRTATLRHVDHLNLFCGMCAVFNIGNFDYQAGGHLVLWDLGLVIEFPPGCSILFPSALLAHSNVPIGLGENRASLTQFSAAGLFRWVHNGGMTDANYWEQASVRQRKAWLQHRERLPEIGLSMLPVD
ncbi:hypothetical protein V5O48_008968 [Marasmius crinis-equi]|uniref:2OGFeDO JBP1/TET oxygenase domain-containing protein n=1 Tax=Marasmius crinis-equi TaxID=585013 RepID=A0ABR3FCG6_9AGAR